MSSRSAKWVAASAAFSLLLVTGTVFATPAERAEEELAVKHCIIRASAGRAWLETTLLAIREQEAGWIGAEMRNENGSVDLGPMQVNSWWIPRIAAATGRGNDEVAQWLRDDPCFNVDAARWIFLSALRDVRDFWRAVGAYHSPTRWRQLQYARKVAAIMERSGRFRR